MLLPPLHPDTHASHAKKIRLITFLPKQHKGVAGAEMNDMTRKILGVRHIGAIWNNKVKGEMQKQGQELNCKAKQKGTWKRVRKELGTLFGALYQPAIPCFFRRKYHKAAT